jgi:hypothetical protein
MSLPQRTLEVAVEVLAQEVEALREQLRRLVTEREEQLEREYQAQDARKAQEVER